MTQASGACSWTTRKAEAAVKPRQALEGHLKKAPFAFISWAEATRIDTNRKSVQTSV